MSAHHRDFLQRDQTSGAFFVRVVRYSSTVAVIVKDRQQPFVGYSRGESITPLPGRSCPLHATKRKVNHISELLTMNVESESLYMAVSSRTVLCCSPEMSTDYVMNIELWAGALIIRKENALKFCSLLPCMLKPSHFKSR